MHSTTASKNFMMPFLLLSITFLSWLSSSHQLVKASLQSKKTEISQDSKILNCTYPFSSHPLNSNEDLECFIKLQDHLPVHCVGIYQDFGSLGKFIPHTVQLNKIFGICTNGRLLPGNEDDNNKQELLVHNQVLILFHQVMTIYFRSSNSRIQAKSIVLLFKAILV